jgi:hypothetical protein
MQKDFGITNPNYFRRVAGILQYRDENGDWVAISSGGGGLSESFETVSKNLKAYSFVLNYTGEQLTSIDYTVPSGVITKTFAYIGDRLDSITLSEETPSGINLTKTLSYTGDLLTGVAYS